MIANSLSHKTFRLTIRIRLTNAFLHRPSEMIGHDSDQTFIWIENIQMHPNHDELDWITLDWIELNFIPQNCFNNDIFDGR
jgi:hypothetical protein